MRPRPADCALNQVSAALGDMRNIAAELARLGYQPGVALFEANIRRALLSVPMVGGSFKLDRLPPNQRVTVLELGQNWAAGVEHRASQKLGDPVKEKEVA
jgi:hypothetical protein